jgi:hypothetical protein
MDKNFIEQTNINEEVKRFKEIAEYKTPKQSLKHLYEYTFITSPQVNEDGEENDGELQQNDNANPDGSPQAPIQNADTENGGQAQDNAQQPMGGDMTQQSAEQQPTVDGEVPMDNTEVSTDTETPNTEMGDEIDDDVETEEMETGDEVIDVDDLTQSQEATEYKVDGVDDRLSQLYNVVQKLGNQLEKNAENIMALKDEFEKRNPTEEEKLNIRSQSSYPYCETPKDYWDNKTKENPHYNVMYNNEVAPSEEQKEFQITKDDISGLNMKEIADSLSIDKKLNDYISF